MVHNVRGGEFKACSIRDEFLERLFDAVQNHADAARRLISVCGRREEFVAAESRSREWAREVEDLRAQYDQHRREHGC